MQKHRVLAATSLVSITALMLPMSGCHTAPTAATKPAATQPATQPADAGGTPDRTADGRVAPTIQADADIYTYANLDERLEKLNKANDQRNKILQDHTLPLAVAVRVPDGSIKIDGKLDDAAWKLATVISDFKDIKTGDVVAEQTKVRLLWDSKYLYVGIECADTDIVATIKDRDGEVWNDDEVEIFANPSGDEMSYLQFVVNPLGTLYDGMIADYRPEAVWKGAGLDMQKSPKVFNVKDSKWAVTVNGVVNAPNPGAGKTWTVEMAIAWTDVNRGTNVIHQVPVDGDVWRMNFGRSNINSGGSDAVISAWSPTPGWFQCPWVFGRVVFVNAVSNNEQSADTKPDDATQPGQ